MLNLRAVEQATVIHDPFDYFVCEGAVPGARATALVRDFPPIDRTGSFPVSLLSYGPAFSTLLDALRSAEFSEVMGRHFDCALAPLPQLITVRGQSGPKDGFVHTDSKWKIITVLLYLNADWTESGGRLRLLRSHRLDDVAAEISPAFGTLVAFRRSNRSFHGHEPCYGKRLVVQLNWVTDETMVLREERRHRRSAALKRLLRAIGRIAPRR